MKPILMEPPFRSTMSFPYHDWSRLTRRLISATSTPSAAAASCIVTVWTERRYEDGKLATTERWTAILTIAFQPPRDAERLKANPLGIYVNAINWSREMGQ